MTDVHEYVGTDTIFPYGHTHRDSSTRSARQEQRGYPDYLFQHDQQDRSREVIQTIYQHDQQDRSREVIQTIYNTISKTGAERLSRLSIFLGNSGTISEVQ